MPEPEFADDADGFALRDADGDVLHGAHGAAPGRELDGEVLNIEKRRPFDGGGFGVHASRPLE